MIDRSRLLLRALLAIALFLSISLAWPVLAGPYRSFLRGFGSGVLAVVSGDSEVRVVPNPRPRAKGTDARWDSVILVNPSNPSEDWSVGYDTRVVGFQSTALLLALVLPTPWRRGRRTLSVLVALAALHAYIAMRLCLVFAWGATQHARACENDARHFAWLRDETWLAIIDGAKTILHNEPAVYSLVPVLIWAMLGIASSSILPSQGSRTS